MLLTNLADTHEERREQRKVFRRYLRRLGYAYDSWGVVEPHKAGGYHCHEWQRGDFIPVETLRRAAVGAGMGEWVGLRKWENRAGGAPGTLYGVKAVARAASLYGVKGVANGGLGSFLEDNGGRYGYWTRDFFGQSYPEARRAAMGLMFDSDSAGEPGEWVLRRDA